MRFVFFAALLSCALGAPSFFPRLPLHLLLSGKMPQIQGGKIVGGIPTQPNEFPFVISLQFRGFAGYSHGCGGSIIDETTIVDAAHCISGEVPSGLRVVAGEHSHSTDSGDEQFRSVSKIVGHENYLPRTFYNDIAILKLAEPLVFSSKVGSIQLPAQGEEMNAGSTVTVVGWGTLVSGGDIPDIMYKVDMPVVSDDDCRQNYGNLSIADSMICAGLAQGGVDSCQGDSGGPLFSQDRTLIGVVSWGYGCAVPGYPGVYTEVAYFRDWIEANRS